MKLVRSPEHDFNKPAHIPCFLEIITAIIFFIPRQNELQTQEHPCGKPQGGRVFYLATVMTTYGFASSKNNALNPNDLVECSKYL